MADSHSLSILMEISSWPCALFTFSALIIFPISLAIISREERVSFGVSSNAGNVLSLATGVHCLQKNSLNKSSKILHLHWDHLIVCQIGNSTHASFHLYVIQMLI